MCPPDTGAMQVAARPVAKRERTDQLTDEVGRTKIPPDFVSFMSRGARKKRSKRNHCSVLAESQYYVYAKIPDVISVREIQLWLMDIQQ